MKARDITVGELYAVGHPDYPSKMLVKEVAEHSKKVYDSGSFLGHMSNPTKMVRVRRASWQEGDQDDWVFPQQVLHPWATQEQINERRNARVAKDRHDLDVREARAERIRERLIGLVDDSRASYAVSAYNGKVELTFDEFAALVGEDL